MGKSSRKGGAPGTKALGTKLANDIRKETTEAFVSRRMVTTSSGEVVLFEDVLEYNRKAEKPLGSTLDRLRAAIQKLKPADRAHTPEIIEELYPRLLPYFIGCGTKNPVHHTAYVMDFMAEILIGEGKHDRFNLTVGMLAALFHDVAQGLSTLPKITEEHLKSKVRAAAGGQCTLAELEDYVEDAVKARQEHMKEGARIAKEELQKYREKHPQHIDDHEIAEIVRIIQHHDDPKIPVAYRVIRRMFDEDASCKAWRSQLPAADKTRLDSLLAQTGEQYLFRADDLLLRYHHEADLLWMVTEHGIEADLARFSPADKKDRGTMMAHNVGLHHEEVELYRGQENFADYKFQYHTVYRSATGYARFKSLIK
jgi:hypothetical protein